MIDKGFEYLSENDTIAACDIWLKVWEAIKYKYKPWGYIGWGDMYFFNKKKDYAKAKEFYEKALAIAKDYHDKIAVQDRLRDLEYEMRN